MSYTYSVYTTNVGEWGMFHVHCMYVRGNVHVHVHVHFYIHTSKAEQ